MLKFSVITVVFNGEKFLEQTIKSVLEQQYSSVEYIVIDGGSKDGTLDILKRYERYIDFCTSEPDDGIYDAMNKGIMHATGDIVGIINSDDFYFPGVFKKVSEVFQNPEIDVVYGDMELFNPQTHNAILIKPSFLNLKRNMTLNHPTCFIRRSCYKSLKFNTKYKLLADYDLILGLKKSKFVFKYIPELISFMRIGGASDNFKLCSIELFEVQKMYFGTLHALRILLVRIIKRAMKFCLLRIFSISFIEKMKGFQHEGSARRNS